MLLGNVLALSVTAYAVPPLPKGEASALPETLHLNRKACAPGSHPFRLAASRQATFPKGTAFSGGDKVSGVT